MHRKIPDSLLVPQLLIIGFLLLSSCAPTSSLPTASPIPSSTPQPPGTPTPTTDWFPATATPTRLPTQPASPTPELRPGISSLLLADDFSDPQAWITGRTAAGSVAFGQNELTLAVAEPKGYLYSLRNNTDLSNYYLEISVAPSLCRGTDTYGLLLRATTAPDYYRFILTCDGQLRLERVKTGTVGLLKDWTSRIGLPVPSRLAAWVEGDEMRFFVDDTFQFSMHDPILTSGSVGVFARSSSDSALTISFSNLTIRAIGGEYSDFPPPTITPNKNIPLAKSPFPTP